MAHGLLTTPGGVGERLQGLVSREFACGAHWDGVLFDQDGLLPAASQGADSVRIGRQQAKLLYKKLAGACGAGTGNAQRMVAFPARHGGLLDLTGPFSHREGGWR